MAKSWELTDEQKKDIEEKNKEVIANWKKEQADKNGETDDVDTLDARERERNDDDENIR